MRMLRRSFICAAMLALCAAARGGGAPIRVSFSDPSRPGELHVSLMAGSITVKGEDTRQVSIQTHARAQGKDSEESQEAAGLNRLTQQPSFTVQEQNNIMSVRADSWVDPVDLIIGVPRRTRLKLSTVNDGQIRVEDVDSELEISNVNGSITLTGIGGCVVAHTINGQILAKLTRVDPQKPMAFTSLNGSVDVQLPAGTKANLKLRTDYGSVFTDFDLKPLPQPTTIVDTRRSGGRYRIEVNKAIYGTVNGGGPTIELRTFNGNIYLRKGG